MSFVPVEERECYRCGHSEVTKDPECPCCNDKHTPDKDGNFSSATAEEFQAWKEGK